MDVLVDKTLNDALKGDVRARAESLKLLRDINLDAELRLKAENQIQELDEADLSILARLQSDQGSTGK